MSVLVGGVGQLYQGDHDVGRRAVEALAGQDLGPGVIVEELHYGAVAIAQRLEELRPAALVLVGAAERGRPPATVERRAIERVELPPEELQRSIGHAVTGYVGIDLVVEVAAALDALPARTVAIEVEPLLGGPADRLSAEVEAALPEIVRLVRAELRAAVGARAGG